MSSIRVTLELDDQGYITKLKMAEAATANLGKAAATSGAAGATGMGLLTGSMVALRAAATAAMTAMAPLLAAATAFAAIRGAFTLADDISDLAEGSGIAAAKIIAFQKALKAAGGDADSAGTMITRLNNFLESAAGGSAEAINKLDDLGISLQDLRTMTPEQALDKTIASLAKMTDPIERNALAFDLLGKRAANINWKTVLEGTATVTDEQVRQGEAAKRLGDAYDQIAGTFGTLKLNLMQALEPIADLIIGFNKLSSLGLVADVVFKSIQAVFALTATSAYALFTAIDSVIGGLVALYKSGKEALSGNFGGALDALNAYGEQTKQNFAAVVDFAKMQYQKLTGTYEAPPVPGEQTTGGLGGAGRSISDPLAKEKAKVQGISDAYQEVNKNIREKLQLEYDNLNVSEEEVKVSEARREAAAKAADEIRKLQEQLKGLDMKKATDRGLAAVIRAEIKEIENLVGAEQNATEQTIREGEKRRREYELNGQKFREAYDLESFKRNIAKQRELEMAVTESQRAEIEIRYAAEEDYQKKLLDLKIKYAGKEIPQPFLDTLNAERTRALDTARQKVGEVSAEEERKKDPKYVLGQWAKGLKDLEDPVKTLKDSMDAVWGGMSSAIDNFVETGKFKFGDFARSIIADLVKIQMKALAVGIFKSVLGSFGVTIPGQADGGPVRGGSPYIVGERGPELFVPNTSGKIIPNNALKSSVNSMGIGNQGTQVTYNINAVDAYSFKQLVAADPQFIYSVTQMGGRSIPR